MKFHRIELYVPDFEDDGLDQILWELDSNPHYVVIVKEAKTTEIEGWGDSHPLNKKDTPVEEFRKYFE